ncbi:MOSC domain-containing protein [Brevibacillus nitrificans]|uniref:MOSC domain-containing protein n=1 Tax=Brevibacillus nitrificans TaxID=651560 RepID=A0A3M8D505_9BACL|nr:MOSC domain-containing protein [Brevibacillus nitrificans]RNB83110.1 MOSC domain-containing protein [Brevibacillus nitrificans]
MSDRKIVYVSKGLPKNMTYNGQEYLSGIWKEQTDELHVATQQIAEDDVANPAYHGGPDRVVCLYPFEHYAHWEKEFDQPLEKAAFGENVTAVNMREDQVCIGDVYQFGDAILQVSQGRYPCATINKRNHNNQLLKQIIAAGYTGYFFRVLQEGTIKSDSPIIQLSAHPAQVTVASIHHLYFHEKSPDPKVLARMLELEELATPWRKKLIEKQQKL